MTGSGYRTSSNSPTKPSFPTSTHSCPTVSNTKKPRRKDGLTSGHLQWHLHQHPQFTRTPWPPTLSAPNVATPTPGTTAQPLAGNALTVTAWANIPPLQKKQRPQWANCHSRAQSPWDSRAWSRMHPERYPRSSSRWWQNHFPSRNRQTHHSLRRIPSTECSHRSSHQSRCRSTPYQYSQDSIDRIPTQPLHSNSITSFLPKEGTLLDTEQLTATQHASDHYKAKKPKHLPKRLIPECRQTPSPWAGTERFSLQNCQNQ